MQAVINLCHPKCLQVKVESNRGLSCGGTSPNLQVFCFGVIKKFAVPLPLSSRNTAQRVLHTGNISHCCRCTSTFPCSPYPLLQSTVHRLCLCVALLYTILMYRYKHARNGWSNGRWSFDQSMNNTTPLLCYDPAPPRLHACIIFLLLPISGSLIFHPHVPLHHPPPSPVPRLSPIPLI